MRRIQNYFTLNKGLLVYRKKLSVFNSIENVFDILLPLLQINKVELPYPSKGLTYRIKNILFLKRKTNSLIHITGYDHYLMWWPFKNTILTIHDIEALKSKKGIKRWIFKKLWFDWPIKNAKVVTTISEFSKSELIKLNKYRTDIKVIHNPLTLPVNYIPKEFNAECPRILHIGMKENKNWKRLILALKGIKCQLILIGEQNADTKNLLEASKIKYQFKSNLTNQEVVEEYINCDMLAFVSTYEGFGLPIIEAQAVGRVVLTSLVTSMPEVAGDGALLVDPYSVQQIKSGIERLIQNKELRDRLIVNGLENVKRFSVENISRQYAHLYETILKN